MPLLTTAKAKPAALATPVAFSPQSPSTKAAQLSPAERTAVHMFFAQQTYLAWAHEHALAARRAISNDKLHLAASTTRGGMPAIPRPIPIQRLNIKDPDVGWTSGAWLWDMTQAPLWFQRAAMSLSRPSPLAAHQVALQSAGPRSWTPTRLRSPTLPPVSQCTSQRPSTGELQGSSGGKRKHRRSRSRRRQRTGSKHQ